MMRIIQKQASLKNFKYNRYMLIRYTLALFFFSNIYWLGMHIITWYWYGLIPISMLLLMIPALIEQIKMYGVDEVYLTATKRFFHGQVIIQVVLLLMIGFTADFSKVFPLLSNTVYTKSVVAGIILLGLGCALINLKRIELIGRNSDKFYKRMQQMEKHTK